MFGGIPRMVSFLKLQVKTFEFSYLSSYVWVMLVKEVPNTGPKLF